MFVSFWRYTLATRLQERRLPAARASLTKKFQSLRGKAARRLRVTGERRRRSRSTSCMPSPAARAGDRTLAVAVDREGERLGRRRRGWRRCRRSRSTHVGIVAAVHQADAPAGEDARRRVDVLLGVVADAEREQLHDLAAEVLLRPLPRVLPSVEPDEHRRILAPPRSSRSRKLPSAYWRNSSIWPCGPGSSPDFSAIIFVACSAADGAGDLAVGRGEVVVPEQRHLLLQRALRVDHPEQPSLPRVLDVRVRRELTARRDADVGVLSDLPVHVVGLRARS